VTASRGGVATTTLRWVPSLLVGLTAFAAARVALLPGLGFWDTAELQGLAAALLIPTAFALPSRLARVDRSTDLEAREWVGRALLTMRPGAVVISWWSYSTPLWYAQHIEGQRPDLAVIDDRTRLDLGLGDVTDVIDANLPNRPVYVIRVDLAEIAAIERRYVLEYLDGPDARYLTRVVSRREAAE
jgi:hypothetical protein